MSNGHRRRLRYGNSPLAGLSPLGLLVVTTELYQRNEPFPAPVDIVHLKA
jgi:hypothetical protein